MAKSLARKYEEEYRRVTGKEVKVFRYGNIYEIDWRLPGRKGIHTQEMNKDQLKYFIDKLKEKPTKVRKG